VIIHLAEKDFFDYVIDGFPEPQQVQVLKPEACAG
jgi:hypothetical protein